MKIVLQIILKRSLHADRTINPVRTGEATEAAFQ